jgi:hypothetical protein
VIAEGSGKSKQSPAEAAPVPTGPLHRWEAVCLALEEAKEFGLMTVYQTAKVLCFDEDGVKLGFPAGGLTSEIALDKEKIIRMREFVQKHSGKDLRFEVVLLNAAEEADAVSIIEDQKQRTADEMVRRHEEAKEHPMTKKVLRTFGAAIKEIKVENV